MVDDKVNAERSVRLRPEWLKHLGQEFSQPYMTTLAAFLREEKAAGKTIYPKGPHIFSALESTPPEAVCVVILGQDPYHGAGQAHGLSFSVPRSVAIPPSLRNIFKEIERDLGIPKPGHGCLEHWAQAGVLLLNTVLTVEASLPGSHQGRGWEQFTDRVVEVIDRFSPPSVFMLWGAYAKQKGAAIDRKKHCVLEASHPSPLSAHRGFLGCGHFGQANRFLTSQGRPPINWALPD
jgi:uracil-DNA glycosylase